MIKTTKYILTTFFLTLVGISSLFISGCCDSIKTREKPILSYLVAYSILDNRFHTSTRLDITADILNETKEEIELTQLILTDLEGNTYTLDYQTIPAFNQEGRFNAIPLKAPISDFELLGQKGIQYNSESGLEFLFVSSFQEAQIKYKNSKGLQTIEVKNLDTVLEKSRNETIEWMKKEEEEKKRVLAELKEKAEKRIAARRAKNKNQKN